MTEDVPLTTLASPKTRAIADQKHNSRVKYEDIYLKDYTTVLALAEGLGSYFQFYNHERPHQSLAYRVPAEVHWV